MLPKITICAIDKIRNKEILSLATEYIKRLQPFAKLEIIELRPEPFRNDSDKVKSKKKEGERILDFISKQKEAEIILLEENGKEYDSISFANFLENKHKHIVFVIGGALGLADELKSSKYLKISLSVMTLPHEIARLILLEQIYRAGTIVAGKKYHY